MMKINSFALLVVLLGLCTGTVNAQNSPKIDASILAKNMEARFESCPKRVVVSKFDRKHHKVVWEKQAWGPPTDVLADVKTNDSILYPYILTVNFSLAITYGPERKSKSEAESDVNLAPLSIPVLSALRAKYRNIYLVGNTGIRLKNREVLDENLNGVPIGWVERPSWPDACWDQIDSK